MKLFGIGRANQYPSGGQEITVTYNDTAAVVDAKGRTYTPRELDPLDWQNVFNSNQQVSIAYSIVDGMLRCMIGDGCVSDVTLADGDIADYVTASVSGSTSRDDRLVAVLMEHSGKGSSLAAAEELIGFLQCSGIDPETTLAVCDMSEPPYYTYHTEGNMYRGPIGAYSPSPLEKPSAANERSMSHTAIMAAMAVWSQCR